MSEADTLFHQGVQAVREKNKAEGKRLLTQALRLDPQNDEAWVWLARAVAEPEKQQQCIERALKINPDNTDALALQNQLTGKSAPPRREAPAKAAPAPSKEQSLGRELGVFSANLTWHTLRLLGGAAVLLPAGLYLWFQLKDDPAGAFDENPVAIIIAGVAALGSVLWILMLFGSMMRRVFVFDGGLRVENMLVLRRTLFWKDISGFTTHNRITKWAAGGTYSKFEYRVFANGSQVLYANDGTENVQQLGNLLIDKTTPVITQQLVDRYNSGDPLKFERGIKISKAGFTYKNNTYAWKEIRDCELKNGNVFIYRHQNPHFGIRVHTFGMQNTLALFRLLALILHPH